MNKKSLKTKKIKFLGIFMVLLFAASMFIPAVLGSSSSVPPIDHSKKLIAVAASPNVDFVLDAIEDWKEKYPGIEIIHGWYGDSYWAYGYASDSNSGNTAN